jgi:transcription elongation factor GreA
MMTKPMFAKKVAPIPLTQEGFNQAKNDFGELQQKREQILLRLQAAREMGDLSENGAYTAAKFELGSTDRELRRLAHLLKYGVVKQKSGNNKVEFGSVVTVKNGSEEMTFTLVSGYESNPAEKKLSMGSPLGAAVLGKAINDKIVVQAPVGEKKYKIIKIG